MLEYFLHLDRYLIELMPVWGDYIYLVVLGVIFMESACILTPFLPGDGLLFVLGLFSAQGMLNIELLMPLVFLATLIGYGVNFMLGKRLGLKLMPWMERRGLKKSLDDSENYYHKYGIKALLIARFMPIVRTFSPMVMGILNLPVFTFWCVNMIGAALWVLTVMGLGWGFGKLGMVSSNISLVIYTIMLISVLPIVFETLKYYWKRHV